MLAAVVAACGGSGSTGLIAPENALLAEVRRDGTCVSAEDSVTYCATDSPDAIGPGGASADGPLEDGGGIATATPGAAAPTPSPAGSAAPTATAPDASPSPPPVATPTAQPTPCPPGSGSCPGAGDLQFVVRGFPEGAACALAARPAGSTGAWSTGPFVPAGGTEVTITPPLPADVTSGLVEVALLCFETPPPELPSHLETLAEAGPDVVFVPAEPVTVSAGVTA
jgi:hypothetical protein